MYSEQMFDALDTMRGPSSSIVEILGSAGTLGPEDNLQVESGTSGSVDPSGKTGRCAGFDEARGKFVVETFDGLVLAVDEEHLREFQPDAAESGGFDVAWPSRLQGYPDFGATLVDKLMEKDHCTVQMFMSEKARDEAIREARAQDYKRMKTELEGAYIGRQTKCKVAWRSELGPDKAGNITILDLCDITISKVCALLPPVSSDTLGFLAADRSKGLLRKPFKDAAEESKMDQDAVSSSDIRRGDLEDHVLFMRQRKLCIFFVLSTRGGTLTLLPQDAEKDPVSLQVAPGRMYIFRHDRMSYEYTPADSDDLVLQAWVLQPAPSFELQKISGDRTSKDQAIGLLKGPPTPDGPRIIVRSMAAGMPGGGDSDSEKFWSLCMSGVDASVKMPYERFDIDTVYKPPEDWTYGFTYTWHGGFCTEDIYAIDAGFFGLGEKEAVMMNPTHKVLCNHGYEALYWGGLRKKDLEGRKTGVFVGDSGNDWSYSFGGGLGQPDNPVAMSYSTRIWATTSGRLSYVFGMRGPIQLCDTACSSSLVAYGLAHTSLRRCEYDQPSSSISNDAAEALCMGVNMIPAPGNFVGLCGPHMLSEKGRCFTFDGSADGFQRGEGSGALLIRHEEKYPDDALACMIGACLNQDGRSASMTAPNGPSQQACIKGSMREAGVQPNDVNTAELHGTGTALGDPIEVGALRGVMKNRQMPLQQVSAKSHIAHLEAGAGMAGIQKCILMCSRCCGNPNCHLIALNAHLDVKGYPTIFNTEIVDFGTQAGYSGVSSFGFGGANARADVWCRAVKGHRKTGKIDQEQLDYVLVTCPVTEGKINWLDGRAVPSPYSDKYEAGRYRVDNIRDEFANYDCSSAVYEGQYQLEGRKDADDKDPGKPLHIVGTWDAWQGSQVMEKDDDGSYIFVLRLGDSRWEQFRLLVDGDPYGMIYPAVDGGSMHTYIEGPDPVGGEKAWLIDGRDDELTAGTLLRIRFRFSGPRSMSWEQVDVPDDDVKVFPHFFVVQGTFTAWRFVDMKKSTDEEGTWEIALKIGNSGEEEFQFARDRDPTQLIYPALPRTTKTSVPARGPDAFGKGKSWLVRGPVGDRVIVRLRLEDGHVVVKTISETKGAKVWESLEGPDRHQYFVAGTFTHGQAVVMEADVERRGVYRYRGEVREMHEAFRVILDDDVNWTMYPQADGSLPGESQVLGPDNANEGQAFRMSSLKVGAKFEIVLDLRAKDKRKIVTVDWLTDSCDFESIRRAIRNALPH